MYCDKSPWKRGVKKESAARRAPRSLRRLVLSCFLFCAVLLLCGCSSDSSGGEKISVPLDVASGKNLSTKTGIQEEPAALSISRVEGDAVSLEIRNGKAGFCAVVARDRAGDPAGIAVEAVAEGKNELTMALTVPDTPALYRLQAYLLDEKMQLVCSSQPKEAALRSDTVSDSRVTGIFAAPELSSEATQEQWKNALRSMKEIGIDTVIVQYSLQQERDRGLQAYFPYKEKDSVHDAGKYPLRRKQVEYILSAASEAGMKVFLGLQLAEEEWFHQDMFQDAQWLDEQYQLSVELADALWSAFGGRYEKTIAGWYLPFELESDEAYHAYYKQIVEKYYAPLTSALKGHSKYGHLDLMISPMMCRSDDIAVWKEMVSYILSNSQIGIIAPQDGIGYGTQTHDSLEAWFQATRNAVNSARSDTGREIALWGNCENYARLQDREEPDPLALTMPMSIRKFIDSMDIAAPYVDKLITFSIHRWDVSMEDSSAVELNKPYYEAYRRFYTSGNKPQGKAEGYYVNIYAKGGASLQFNQYAQGGLTDGFSTDPDNWKEYVGVKTSGEEPFVMEIAFDDSISLQRIVSNYSEDKAADIGIPERVNYEYFVRSDEDDPAVQYFPFYLETFPDAKGITRSVATAAKPVTADGIRITVTPSAGWTFLDEIWVD